MDADKLGKMLQEQFRLHVERHMRAYVLQRLEQNQTATLPAPVIPVIGADARTGVAVRRLVPLDSWGA